MAFRLLAMDVVAFVAERKIQAAMDQGLFDGLPPRGFIDCSLHGEAFIAKWFRDKFAVPPSEEEGS